MCYDATSNTATTSGTLSYDTAGNLTQTLSSDGSKTLYTYDDADRLTRLERRNAAGVPVSASEWVYDYASRKPVSREFTYSNGAWAQTSEKRRVFDDMDVVQERNGLNQVTAQLVRSGNIGGILSRSTNAGASFYGYDGGGNVTLLTDANGAEVGHYRYDAFGSTLESSGIRAGENPYRFSTKELGSSGLYDYGFRFYSPSSGTWINRDPSSEDGGINLYGMVDNDPINSIDEYGLSGTVLVLYQSRGGSRADVMKVKRATERMLRSPTGQHIVQLILARGYPVYMYVTKTGSNYMNPGNHPGPGVVNNSFGIFINPSNPDTGVWVRDKKGVISFEDTPLEIIIGHEMGHEVGQLDDNWTSTDLIGDVVRFYENPLRRWFGLPERYKYDLSPPDGFGFQTID